MQIKPEKIAQIRSALVVFFLYLLLSTIMTYPTIFELGTRMPAGASDDVMIHQWVFGWLKQALLEGHNPYRTTMIFYPDGASLTTLNIAWANFLVWFPLQALFGHASAFSLMYIVIFALNGFSGYLLAKEWTRSKTAAFVGGMVFGFWLGAISRSGQPNLTFLMPIPLALLYLGRTLEHARKKDAVLAGLFVAMIGWVRWQLLVMASIALAITMVAVFILKRPAITKRMMGSLALSGFVVLVMIAPLAGPVVWDQLSSAPSESIFNDQSSPDGIDLMALFLPNERLTFWGKLAPFLPQDLFFDTNRIDFLGYFVVALGLVGIIKNRRHGFLWLSIAAIYLALALGPDLTIAGRIFHAVPMPYRLIGNSFLGPIVRKPHRFMVLLGLPLGMLVAMGLSSLQNSPVLKSKRLLLVIGALALVFIDCCQIPYPVRRQRTPSWFQELAQEPGMFGILDLPLDPDSANKRYMFYQLTHGKPIVEGHISRPPDSVLDFLNGTPFLARLLDANEMDPTLRDASHQLSVLADTDVRYLVLHKKIAEPYQLDDWREWMVVDPYHEDAYLIVYRTRPEYGKDFAFIHESGDGIGVINTDLVLKDTSRGQKIIANINWGSSQAPQHDDHVCLQLVDRSGQVFQTACEPISVDWPTHKWEANEVVRGKYQFWVDENVKHQTYRVNMRVHDSLDGNALASPLALGDVDLETLQVNPADD